MIITFNGLVKRAGTGRLRKSGRMNRELCEGRETGISDCRPSSLKLFQRQQPDFFGAAFFVSFFAAAFFFGAAFFTVAIYFLLLFWC